MADGLNRATLVGNLGADPELRFTQGGSAVMSMRLATTTSYLDKDKKRVESTQWHTVVVWGARGEALSKILKKGQRTCVEGEIRYSEYEDKDGHKRHKTEVHATNVVLCGAEGSGGARRDDERDDRRRGRDDDRRGGREDDRGEDRRREAWE
jgi:single-strand DNA-binding protein